MTAGEALSELSGFLASNPPIEVATVAKPATAEAQHEARYLPLEDKAEAYFRRITAEAIIDAPTEADLRPFDPTYKPEADTIEWTPLADVEPVRVACERYMSLNSLSNFVPRDAAYKKRLLFWVGSRSEGGRRAFFFRAFSAAAELKRKNLAAIVSRDGPFQLLDEEIFLFDTNVDCVVFGGYVFVLRKNDYRRIFEQLEQLREVAIHAAGRLNERVPIANFDEFAQACARQPAMADKLVAIQSRDYFSRLSYEMLAPVIDEFELEIPIVEQDGAPHLVFQSPPAYRWRILRLVDDDFLRSSMTDHQYEVNSKTTKA
jgi:Domain of unknown function (DUF4868)